MVLACAQTTSTFHAEAVLHWGTRRGLGDWGIFNRVTTAAGGSHVRGMWHGLVDGVNAFVRTQSWAVAATPRVRMAQIPYTLSGIVAVETPAVTYVGAMKEQIADPAIRRFVRHMVRTQIVAQLAQQPALVRHWVDRVGATPSAIHNR